MGRGQGKKRGSATRAAEGAAASAAAAAPDVVAAAARTAAVAAAAVPAVVAAAAARAPVGALSPRSTSAQLPLSNTPDHDVAAAAAPAQHGGGDGDAAVTAPPAAQPRAGQHDEKGGVGGAAAPATAPLATQHGGDAAAPATAQPAAPHGGGGEVAAELAELEKREAAAVAAEDYAEAGVMKSRIAALRDVAPELARLEAEKAAAVAARDYAKAQRVKEDIARLRGRPSGDAAAPPPTATAPSAPPLHALQEGGEAGKAAAARDAAEVVALRRQTEEAERTADGLRHQLREQEVRHGQDKQAGHVLYPVEGAGGSVSFAAARAVIAVADATGELVWTEGGAALLQTVEPESVLRIARQMGYTPPPPPPPATGAGGSAAGCAPLRTPPARVDPWTAPPTDADALRQLREAVPAASELPDGLLRDILDSVGGDVRKAVPKVREVLGETQWVRVTFADAELGMAVRVRPEGCSKSDPCVGEVVRKWARDAVVRWRGDPPSGIPREHRISQVWWDREAGAERAAGGGGGTQNGGPPLVATPLDVLEIPGAAELEAYRRGTHRPSLPPRGEPGLMELYARRGAEAEHARLSADPTPLIRDPRTTRRLFPLCPRPTDADRRALGTPEAMSLIRISFELLLTACGLRLRLPAPGAPGFAVVPAAEGGGTAAAASAGAPLCLALMSVGDLGFEHLKLPLLRALAAHDVTRELAAGVLCDTLRVDDAQRSKTRDELRGGGGPSKPVEAAPPWPVGSRPEVQNDAESARQACAAAGVAWSAAHAASVGRTGTVTGVDGERRRVRVDAGAYQLAFPARAHGEGMGFNTNRGDPVVTEVFAGGCAERAGLVPGARLSCIDGRPVGATGVTKSHFPTGPRGFLVDVAAPEGGAAEAEWPLQLLAARVADVQRPTAAGAPLRVAQGRQLEVRHGDLTAAGTDAVVNAANGGLWLGGGIAGALDRACGPALQRDCTATLARLQAEGLRSHELPNGSAVATGAGWLEREGVRCVVHAVGPRCTGAPTRRDEEELADAVHSALYAAAAKGAQTVALPCLSSGIFGYPKPAAARVVVRAAARLLRMQAMPPPRVYPTAAAGGRGARLPPPTSVVLVAHDAETVRCFTDALQGVDAGSGHNGSQHRGKGKGAQQGDKSWWPSWS